tara:strand:+ start:1701 stop:2633 length:933 start_codon:yes stop_codon:yes gene_type:complete
MKNLEKIKGDASFRQFFRKKNKNFNSIIVFAKKEKIKNLLIYDAINKILNKNRILAPELYQEDYKKNYIEIQDFGNDTIYKILKKKKNKRFFYFEKIIKILNKIQAIKNRKIKNFKKKTYAIPEYKREILLQEANLFSEWYVTKNKKKFKEKFKKIIKRLVSHLKLRNNVFVHRDFHVSNLMLHNDKLGVIDNQDALIGNKAYDLASLIDDVRFKTSRSFKNHVYKMYINKQKTLNKDNFKNDFEILSILRNLKIIGIFTRLSKRDGKKNYLKLIPYAWKLINLRINDNEIFIDLKDLLKKNFKEKINEN